MNAKEYVQNLDFNWKDRLEVNKKLRRIFEDFIKDPENFPYRKVLDTVQSLHPHHVKDQFGQRMDHGGRSLGQLGMDLYNGHLREKRIAEFWLGKFAEHHFGPVRSKCVGVDDSGCLFVHTFTKEETKRPDYLLHTRNGDVYLEIKSNRCDWKYTPKRADIEHYLGCDLPTYVLGLCSDGYLEEDCGNCTCYFLIAPEQSQRMLTESSVIHGRKESGGKPAFQFYFNLDDDKLNYYRRLEKIHRLAKPLDNFCDVHWLKRRRRG